MSITGRPYENEEEDAGGQAERGGIKGLVFYEAFTEDVELFHRDLNWQMKNMLSRVLHTHQLALNATPIPWCPAPCTASSAPRY